MSNAGTTLEASLRELLSPGGETGLADSLAERIRGGDGRALFRELLRPGARESRDRYQRYRQLGQLLEDLLPAQPFVAAYLLARLRGAAGRTTFHDVYDHIELIFWDRRAALEPIAEAIQLLERERFDRKWSQRWLLRHSASLR